MRVLVIKKRKELWENLTDISQHINLPWLVIGDFNDISPHEKFGGKLANRIKMETSTIS